MITRNLDLDDLSQVKACIEEHTTMYSVPINHTDVLSRIESYIKNQYAVGCFDNNKCIGVSTQFFWSSMPIWSASNLFISPGIPDSNYLSDLKIKIMGSLMQQMISNGEKDDRYEFYYITRDSKSFSKKIKSYNTIQKSNNEVAERYDYIDLHIIQTPDDIKWPYIRELLGNIGMVAIQPPYNKTLIVRKAILKSQYRL